jgi:hypothetical protein
LRCLRVKNHRDVPARVRIKHCRKSTKPCPVPLFPTPGRTGHFFDAALELSLPSRVESLPLVSAPSRGKPQGWRLWRSPRRGRFACRTIYDTQMFALVSSTEQIAGQPHIRITYGGGNDEVVSCSVDAVSSKPFAFTIRWPRSPRQLANWPMRFHPVQSATPSLGKHGGPTPPLIYKIGSARLDCSRRRGSSCSA